MAKCRNNDDACTLLGSARGFADSYQFGFPCTRGDRHRGPRFSRQQTLQSTSFVIQINCCGRLAAPAQIPVCAPNAPGSPPRVMTSNRQSG
jgi:hypothetical protein